MFSLLKRLIQYFSAFLIAVGIIRHSIYYGYFHVSIEDFIGTGEFLLLFADDIFLNLVIWIVVVGLGSLFLHDTIGEWNYIKLQNDAKKKFKQRILSEEYLYNIFLFIVFLVVFFFKKDYLTNVIFFFLLLSTLTPIIVREIKYKYDTLSDTPLDIGYLNLLQLTIFAGTFVAMQATLSAVKTANGRYIGTIIQTSDSTYVSDSTFFFIGKTDNYTLMYNKADNTSTIIPNGEIKKFVLKKK